MRGICFPIMIGCYDKPDKCSVIAKDTKYGEYSLLICRLKKPIEYGEEVSEDNLKNIIAHIHFCKLKSAQAFRDAMIKLVQQWEREE